MKLFIGTKVEIKENDFNRDASISIVGMFRRKIDAINSIRIDIQEPGVNVFMSFDEANEAASNFSEDESDSYQEIITYIWEDDLSKCIAYGWYGDGEFSRGKDEENLPIFFLNSSRT